MTSISALWQNLHAHPEPAGQEHQTRKILQDYLRQESDLQLFDRGSWFYGIHDEQAAETIGIRADMDAIFTSRGTLFHGCGHDGHMAMACACAHRIAGKKIGRNVVFLFQPAEENGQGAAECLPLFAERRIDRMLGLHNIPGYPLGQVLVTRGTFADGSLGLILHLKGKQSHAAYPEDGINPAFAISQLVCRLPQIQRLICFEQFQETTVIYVHVGEPNFGINAGEGEIGLTLRAQKNTDLKRLKETVIQEMKEAILEAYAPEQAAQVQLEIREQDVFPATENRPEDADHVMQMLQRDGFDAALLPEPMRWSEDFGHYTAKTETFFFGLGSGIEQPNLHTDPYVFPTELLEKGGQVWEEMLKIF
jgi:amidohydrolase